jgi:hypothetical protein
LYAGRHATRRLRRHDPDHARSLSRLSGPRWDDSYGDQAVASASSAVRALSQDAIARPGRQMRESDESAARPSCKGAACGRCRRGSRARRPDLRGAHPVRLIASRIIAAATSAAAGATRAPAFSVGILPPLNAARRSAG